MGNSSIKSKGKKVHIGEMIKEKVNTSGFTVTEFAEKIGLSRPAVYQLFNKQSIDTELLVRISLLLKENFVKYIFQYIEENLQKEKEGKELDTTPCPQDAKKLFTKIELIHQDLVHIKNILVEIKESKMIND